MKYLKKITASTEIDTSLEYGVVYYNEDNNEVTIKKYSNPRFQTVVTYADSTTWKGVINGTSIVGSWNYEVPQATTQIPNIYEAVSISLQEGLIEIGEAALSMDSVGDEGKLTSVIIPNSVTRIGRFAFYRDIKLVSVTLSDNITEIGDGAFWGCTNLKSITYKGVTYTPSQAWDLVDVFEENGVLSLDDFNSVFSYTPFERAS